MSEQNICSECKKTFQTPAALKAHNTRFNCGKELTKEEEVKTESPENKTTEEKPDVPTLKEIPEKKEKRVLINILHVDGELDYVFASVISDDAPVKGNPFRIKRGVWVEVPKSIFLMLQDAVVNTTKYVPDPDVPGKYTRVPHSYTKYPMQTREIAA